MKARSSVGAAVLALLCGAAGAQGVPLEGSVRAAWWSSSAQFDDRDDVASAALWLRSTPDLGPAGRLVLEGWVRNDDALGHGSQRGPTRARLREAYWRVDNEAWDLRLGQQLVVWGRADRINPTDNVSPRDYTLLTPEDVDQRRGVAAAALAWRGDGVTVTGYWLPRFSPNRLPLPRLPGVRWREEVPHARQGAVKVDASSGALDWSLSWYDGLDLNPDLRAGALSAEGAELVLTHNRIRVIGADAATVLGRYGLRAEAAYTRTATSNDPLIRKPFLYVVAGGDRTYGEYFNVNLQLYLRRVNDYRDPRALPDSPLRGAAVQWAIMGNQLERSQHGLTYRISDKWLHETLEGELAGQVALSRREWAFKPRLTYAISDHWRATAGMNWYRGDSDTFFHLLAPTSGAFVELKYSF